VHHADNLIVGAQPDINRVARNGVQIAEKVNILVTGLNHGKGPTGLLLTDEATKQQFQPR